MILEIILGVICIWYIIARFKLRKFNELSRELGDNQNLPLIGHAHKFFGNREDLMNILEEYSYKAMRNKHGIASIWLGPNIVLMVSDAEVARIITNEFLEKSDYMLMFKDLAGNGGIFAPVKIWRPRRKLTMPCFTVNNLNPFQKIFQKQAILIAKRLEEMTDKGIFCVRQFVDEYNVNAVHESILGFEVESGDKTFVKAFHDFKNVVTERFFKPWLHSDLVYRFCPSYKHSKRNRDIIWTFINNKINEIRNENTKSTSEKNEDFEENNFKFKPLMEILMTQFSNNKGFTDIELREESLVLLLASTDTAATAIAFTCLMLSRYPEIQEKVYEELINVFGDSERHVELNDLSDLKYLEAVIKETIRLYPPLPLVMRKVTHDLKLPTGITLVEGAEILLSIMGVNRNPKYWGNDAEEFKPERWLNDTQQNPAFISFSYGPRNCPGMKYALMSAKTVLAVLLRKYRFITATSPGKEKEPIRFEFSFAFVPIDGFLLKIERR